MPRFSWGGRATLLVAAVLPFLLSVPAFAHGAVHFSACTKGSAFDCATVRVPLDRSGRVPGSIRLHVQRRHGTAGRSVVWIGLAGGPGQAATPQASGLWAKLDAPVRSVDQIVLFDQRGTGRSSLIDCSHAVEHAPTVAAATRRCGERLGRRRPFYTTTQSVEDIESVRRAVGAEKVELLGISYGTYVALRYARAHPDRTAGLILDSTVPLSGVDQWNRTTFAAVPRVLRQLCAGDACPTTADPVADFARVAHAMATRRRSAPLLVPVGRRVQAHSRRLGGPSSLFDLLEAGDFLPASRAFVPGAIAAARRGDWAPLVRLSEFSGGGLGQSARAGGSDWNPQAANSDGLYLATTCGDTALAWPANTRLGAPRTRALDDALAALPSSAFAPFSKTSARIASVDKTCRTWPATHTTPYRDSGVPLDVPALIVSGAADLRTPTEDAQRAKALLPDGSLVVVPGVGHSALGADPTDCAMTAYRRFVAGTAVGTPCAVASRAPATQPRPPLRLSEVAPFGAAGTPGRLARVATRTVQDALGMTALQAGQGAPTVRFGGLRAGLASGTLGARSSRLTLTRYALLRGVGVSGTVRVSATTGVRATLKVDGGPVARRGRLTIDAAGVRGRIGGVAVSAPLPGAVAATARATARTSPSNPAPSVYPVTARPGSSAG